MSWNDTCKGATLRRPNPTEEKDVPDDKYWVICYIDGEEQAGEDGTFGSMQEAREFGEEQVHKNGHDCACIFDNYDKRWPEPLEEIS